VAFQATLPALGYGTFIVTTNRSGDAVSSKETGAGSDVYVSNGLVSFVVNGTTGKLSAVTNEVTGASANITQVSFFVGSVACGVAAR
jgi:hypothetical protein